LQGFFQKNPKKFFVYFHFLEKVLKKCKKTLDKGRTLCYNIKLHYNAELSPVATSAEILIKTIIYAYARILAAPM